MPLGWTTPQYASLVAISLGSMLFGSTIVHNFYKPDLSIPETPEKRTTCDNESGTKKKLPIAIVKPRGHRDEDA
eukprot:m.240971 g.240971  ORF g.240971 m.240971 type:complete len:74 (-) comp16847_c0_seq1:55-276(-)